MKLAKVKTYEVSKENFQLIKKIFDDYVFSRKSDDGKYFVKLDKRQEQILEQLEVQYK